MIIHRYWEGPTPPYSFPSAESLGSMEHTPATVPSWIIQQSDHGMKGSGPQHRANLVRYWALHQWGGLWMDYDVWPYVDLTRFAPGPWVPLAFGVPAISVMCFPEPGHPIFPALLHGRTHNGRSVDISGSVVFAEAMKDHPDISAIPGVFGKPAEHLWWSSSKYRVSQEG